MTKYSIGDVNVADLLLPWISSLPNLQRPGTRYSMLNKFGDVAEHYVFRTTHECLVGGVERWHGTVPHCIRSILMNGMQNPFDSAGTFQEFREPGIYTADVLTETGALHHATSVRFALTPQAAIPYTRLVLKLVCYGSPIAQRSYGDCSQIVYDAANVVVKEVHCFRGLGFYNKGDHHFDCLDGSLVLEAEQFRALAPQPVIDGDLYEDAAPISPGLRHMARAPMQLAENPDVNSQPDSKKTWERFDAGNGRYWWIAKIHGSYVDRLHFFEDDPNWIYDAAGRYWTDDRDELFVVGISGNEGIDWDIV